MASSPVYLASRRPSAVLVNTANTNTDGTSGSFADVWTAGSSGSLIESVQIKGITASGSTQSADMVRLWAYNGTTRYLIKEVTIAAGGGAISATVQNADQVVALNVPLATGWKLQASTHVGGATASYHVTGYGGDY